MSVPLYYPDGNPILVTEETLMKTPHSFNYYSGLSEPASIEYFFSLVNSKHATTPALILDIGAQSGLYSLYAKHLPSFNFLSFEPYPISYKLLLDNLSINEISNVIPFNIALGSKNEKKTLRVPEHIGLNTLGATPKRFDTWNEIEVDVLRLDDIIYDHLPVHYIKCDTEGWEYYVLKGAERILRKWKPDLFLEICDKNLEQAGVERKDLEEYLESLHYKQVCVVDNENYHFRYQEP